jgi:hypothetical protein
VRHRSLLSFAAMAGALALAGFTLRQGSVRSANGGTRSQEATAQPAQPADSPVLNDLLEEVRLESAQLDVDAEALLFMDRSPVWRQAHAQELNVIRGHINEIGKLERRMRDARDPGSPWQQQAVDQVGPLLQQMADNLTSAIEHYNRTRHVSHTGPYADYLQANADMAARLHAMVSDSVAYGKAKASFEKQSSPSEPGN